MQRSHILETAFHGSPNNSQGPAFPQIGSMQFASDWEETLNDIDEIIQSELGCTQGLYAKTPLFGQAEMQELSGHVQPMANESSTKWHFPG